MNVIQLCGGIGNQLFQYAFGRAQVANGVQDVRYDDTWYRKHGKGRPYRLDKFHVDVKVGSFSSRNVLKEKEFNLELLKTSNRNFSGYWQHLAYYENILPILRKEFRVRKEFYTRDYLNLRKRIVGNPSVSVHVRRGDYVELEDFHVMPLDYYFKALKRVEGNLFIFSDDIEWCRENFKIDYFSREIIFVDLEDYLDFELMKSCKHNIIARSSFSWWPAYLNDNPGRTVIAPARWIMNRTGQYPGNWIKL